MVGDVLTMIDDQISRTTRRACGQRRQLFLSLNERQRALIRPLFDLNSAMAFAIHNRYHPDIKRKIYVVCAREMNKPCYYCHHRVGEKPLCDAEVSFILPIFVYSLIDTRSGRRILYHDQDGVEQPVAGLRLLELTAFGAVRDVLATFSTFVHAGGNIAGCDWTLEQFVSTQGRFIVTTPMPLKPMHPHVEALIPPGEVVRRSVLEFAPPIFYTA